MTNRTCSLADCDRRHMAKGYCRKHYYALAYVFPATPCRVSGCELMTTVRTGDGLCETHYARVRRHGGTDIKGYTRLFGPTLADVLLARSEPWGDCVLWTGCTTRDGYPSSVVTDDRRSVPAHRASYEMSVGPIPDGLTLDHLCHTRSSDCDDGGSCRHRRCINPSHVEPVTRSENSRRRWMRTTA